MVVAVEATPTATVHEATVQSVQQVDLGTDATAREMEEMREGVIVSTRRGDGIGASIPEGMFTASQFARKVGVSVDTIRRWVKDGYLEPADTLQAGQLTVRLFADEQVAPAKKLARQRGYIVNRAA